MEPEVMDINLWISIAVAIPLAIIANLATPKIQAWFDKREKKKSLKRTKQIKTEYLEIKPFYEDRALFREYMLWIVIKATFIGSMVSILAAIFVMFPIIMEQFIFDMIRNVFISIAQFISLTGALMIVNICGKALRIYTKIQNYEEYKNAVIDAIGEEPK
jgi:hypothetical protein